MRRYRLLFASLMTCLIAGILCSCTNKNPKESKTISVTIAPLAFLAEQIAGDQYQIETFVPNGSSPETYEPAPQQLVRLNQSKVYFYVGHLGFEQTWLQKMKTNAPQTSFVNASEGIEYLTSVHQHGDHAHEGVDPHVWTTPANLIIMARNMTKQLQELYPDDQELFARNLKTLTDSLERTDQTIRTLLANAPQRAFLIYHPTLSYFAQTYHLEQLVIEEDGKSPSPAHLQSLIRQCRDKKIGTVFLQKEFDRRNAEIIAQETNTRIVEINPLDYQCTDELIHIAKTLSHDLNANHSTH